MKFLLWLWITCSSFVVKLISLLQIGQSGTSLLLKLSRIQHLQLSELHTQIFVSSNLISSSFLLPNAKTITPCFRVYIDQKVMRLFGITFYLEKIKLVLR
jgi:hypothetical protein